MKLKGFYRTGVLNATLCAAIVLLGCPLTTSTTPDGTTAGVAGCTAGDTAKAALTIGGAELSKTAEVYVTESSQTVIKGTSNENNYAGVFIQGRTVTLSPFIMGRYQVTQELYKIVMEGESVTVDGTEYSLSPEPSFCSAFSEKYELSSAGVQKLRPVEGITWYDAVYFCNALSEKTGLVAAYDIEVTAVSAKSGGHITAANVTLHLDVKGYRLPTEAEWEFAARGGDTSGTAWNYTFSGADTAKGTAYSSGANTGLDRVGWYCYNNKTGITGETRVTLSADGMGTHEVGLKGENALGLYDMSGNVWEWCWDRYGDVEKISESDPVGAASGNFRVRRGGSWSDNACSTSVCNRYGTAPDSMNNALGFRVVRSY